MHASLWHRRAISSAGLLAAALLAGCGQGAHTGDYRPPQGDDDELEVTSCLTNPVRVVHIVDGDTLDVLMAHPTTGEELEERVRFTGIQAPEIAHSDEPAEPCGDAAHLYVETTVGTRVELQFDSTCADDPLAECRGDYGRLLAYIKLADCTDLGARLLQNGLARVFDRDPFDKREEYKALYTAAQSDQLGIHGDGCQ